MSSQQSRRYATEPSSGGSNTLLYGGVAAVLAGAGYYFYSQGDNSKKLQDAAQKAEGKAKELVGQSGKKASEAGSTGATFTGGDQGFVSLKLDSVEVVNHNVKILKFAFPDPNAVSGLHIASALLTKYQAPGMEKPVMRPYTPISDEGDS